MDGGTNPLSLALLCALLSLLLFSPRDGSVGRACRSRSQKEKREKSFEKKTKKAKRKSTNNPISKSKKASQTHRVSHLISRDGRVYIHKKHENTHRNEIFSLVVVIVINQINVLI